MYTPTSRGFIPLVAIVIVGLIVAAGGTIAAVSIRSSGEKPGAAKNEAVATTTDGAYSGPVSSQIESSEENKGIVTPKSVSTHVEANTKAAVSISAGMREICTEAKSDLANVKANGDGTGDLNHTRKSASLLGSVVELCNALEKDLANGHSDAESTREKEQAIKEKWQLWQIAGSSQRITEPTEVEDTEEQVTYDSAQCIAQKKELLPQADSMYLQWYEQWREAMRSLDGCYNSNPVPVCDKQATNLNVEWQAKVTAQFDDLHDRLTKCAPDDRRFEDVSSVVPGPY